MPYINCQAEPFQGTTVRISIYLDERSESVNIFPSEHQVIGLVNAFLLIVINQETSQIFNKF